MVEQLISVALPAGDCAQIAIDESGNLTVSRGQWPHFAGPVQTHGVAVALEPGDAFIYLDQEGGIVVSDAFMAYGRDGAGNANEMLDLLAWREGSEWHVKRLVGQEG